MSNSLPQRKRPVHVAPVERHNTHVVLFVTLGIQPRRPCLANIRFQDSFTKGCVEADAWSVGFYLIMPDHVHFFCCPAAEPQIGIKRWTSYLKRRVTVHYGAHEWDWQSDCWDTQMRSQEHYHERWEYVRQNPVRKELVECVEDWLWQGELNVIRW